jgi:hypothetical protein
MQVAVVAAHPAVIAVLPAKIRNLDYTAHKDLAAKDLVTQSPRALLQGNVTVEMGGTRRR